MKYIASWSGGKDSTASIILAHEYVGMAVSALKENQQHHEIETVKVRRDNDRWIPEKEKPPEKKSVLMCDAAGCRDVGWWNGQKRYK